MEADILSTSPHILAYPSIWWPYGVYDFSYHQIKARLVWSETENHLWLSRWGIPVRSALV